MCFFVIGLISCDGIPGLISCGDNIEVYSDFSGYDKAALNVISTYGDSSIDDFSFAASENWSVEIQNTSDTEESWITVSKMNGKAGEFSVKITLDANHGDYLRTADINFTTKKSAMTIVVKQYGKKGVEESQMLNEVVIQ